MSSEDRILDLLKSRGAQRATALGAALEITASAVRQHLSALAGDLLSESANTGDGEASTALAQPTHRHQAADTPRQQDCARDAGTPGYAVSHDLCSQTQRTQLQCGNSGAEEACNHPDKTHHQRWKREQGGGIGTQQLHSFAGNGGAHVPN